MPMLATLFNNRESGLGTLVAFRDLAQEAIIAREKRVRPTMVKINFKNPLGIFLAQAVIAIFGK